MHRYLCIHKICVYFSQKQKQGKTQPVRLTSQSTQSYNKPEQGLQALGHPPQALKLDGDHLKYKMADTIFFFFKAVPLDPKMNTGNLNLISLIVWL